MPIETAELSIAERFRHRICGAAHECCICAAVYDLFLADRGTAPSCKSASCVLYWPPVLTTGAPQPGTGVTGSLLGTTARADGTTQVTYPRHPPYRFALDKATGDARGPGSELSRRSVVRRGPSGMQIG